MSLSTFADEYDGLQPGEQALFAESVRRVLAEGLIWWGDPSDQRVYSFLLRRFGLVSQYLDVAGWNLRHDEAVRVFHVVHKEGAHRRRLTREQSTWLLLLRMLYAEGRESGSLTLTRNPVVSVEQIGSRYGEFFPGQVVRKKASRDNALSLYSRLKLIRAVNSDARASGEDQLFELLPTLDVVLPSDVFAQALDQFRTTPGADEAEDHAGEDADLDEEEER